MKSSSNPDDTKSDPYSRNWDLIFERIRLNKRKQQVDNDLKAYSQEGIPRRLKFNPISSPYEDTNSSHLADIKKGVAEFTGTHVGTNSSGLQLSQKEKRLEDLTEEKGKEKQAINEGGDTSPCIFGTPFSGFDFQKPRLASIGPYQRGKNLPLDKYKCFFLDKFMSRKDNQDRDLWFYVRQMMKLEWRTRRSYSEDFLISSPEFIEMMLIDGCFLIGVLSYLSRSEESEDEGFPIEPWMIPILIQDLLMLENQVPFFVLQVLYGYESGAAAVSISTMAMKMFNLAFPLHFNYNLNCMKPKHLLDLFLQYIRPSNPNLSTLQLKTESVCSFFKRNKQENQAHVSKRDELETPHLDTNPSPKGDLSSIHYEPSTSKRGKLEQKSDSPAQVRLGKSIKELQMLNIEFRPSKAKKFTDISFRNGVLEIPSVTINDVFMTVLINCMAFEHHSHVSSKYLTAYVCFMSNLIKHPSDVEFLSSNGFITRFSNDYEIIVESFQLLQTITSELHMEDSYLSRTLLEMESYYNKDRITWLGQHYFVRYWKVSLLCIVNLLFAANRLSLIMNRMIQFFKESIPGAECMAKLKQGDICASLQGQSNLLIFWKLLVLSIYDVIMGLGFWKILAFSLLYLIIFFSKEILKKGFSFRHSSQH